MHLLYVILSLWTSVAVTKIAGEQSYRVWGSDLMPTADTVTVIAPEGFRISLISGFEYKSKIKLPYTNSKLDTTLIYVVFAPNTEKKYLDSIANVGGGAAAYVQVNGKGVNNVQLSQISSVNNIIKYTIFRHDGVLLKVFSYDGILLQTPVNEIQSPGTYIINIQLPSGIYYYTLNVGNAPIINKALIIQ